MSYSLITRLLQISPAAAAIFTLASFAGSAAPEVALVNDVPSHEGRYVATLAPAKASAWDGSAGWTISLHDTNGEPVEGAALAVEGWMPEGRDTTAQRAGAAELGDGRYHVDGIALGASGWWNVKLAIAGAAADSLAFNVVLR